MLFFSKMVRAQNIVSLLLHYFSMRMEFRKQSCIMNLNLICL